MNTITMIFVLGSIAMTAQVVKDMEFKNGLERALTYIITWAIMFVLSFGTFALVIGI